MKLKKKIRNITGCITAAAVSMFATMSAYAADEQNAQTLAAFTKLDLWLKKLTTSTKSIGYTVAGLAVIVLAIILITAGQEGLGKGKKMAVAVLLGIALLSSGTSIVSELK